MLPALPLYRGSMSRLGSHISTRTLTSSLRKSITIMATPGAPRRFAPLKASPGQTQEAVPTLQGIIFDVDGTLSIHQPYMFTQMRSVLGITKSVDILTHIYQLPTAAEQETAMQAIRAIERDAMDKQEAQPGLGKLMNYLKERGVRKALCTRNYDQPVLHMVQKYMPGHEFAPILTRDFRPPKPHPAPLLHIARTWGLVRGQGEGVQISKPESAANGVDEDVGDASRLIMVGDSIDDITAGRLAGAATVLLANDMNTELLEHPYTDLVIQSLDELIGVLENGFVGREIPV